jgi:diacylglycerol kinase family enzyme
MISITNGKRFGGGFRVAPNAIITDGLLDVNIIGTVSPVNRVKYLPVIEKGAHLGLDFIKYKQSERIIIHSSVQLDAHMDGEYFTDNSFDIEILPKRFRFIF